MSIYVFVKQTKNQTKEVETIDDNKVTSKDSETESKEDSVESGKQQGADAKDVVATETPTEASQPETAEKQGGDSSDGTNDARQGTTVDTEDVGNGSGVSQMETMETRESENQPAEAVSVQAPTTRSAPDAIKILKRGEVVPEQSKPQDDTAPNGQIKQSSAEPPATHQDCRSAESPKSNNVTSYPEASNPCLPSEQGKQPLDACPPTSYQKTDKKKTHSDGAAPGDASIYSLEPDEEDEGDDCRLIEFLARQGDRAMAHSPDNNPAFLTSGDATHRFTNSEMYLVKEDKSGSGKATTGTVGDDNKGTNSGGGQTRDTYGDRAVNGEGSSYNEGRPYHQYGGGGYHMATGMLGGSQHPPTALGLNPVEPSMNFKWVIISHGLFNKIYRLFVHLCNVL